MNRRSFVVSILALPFATSVFAQDADTPEGVVRALYAAHRRVVETGNPADGALDDEALLRRFFSQRIVNAVQQLRRRGRSMYEELDDFDPILNASGPELDEVVSVRVIEGDGRRATVDVVLRVDALTNELRLHLSRVDGTWRVAEIEQIGRRGEERWRLTQRLNESLRRR